MLKYRLLVAAVGIPIGLAAIILGSYFFLALAVLIALLGLHEYYTLLRLYKPNLLAGYIAAMLVLVGGFFVGQPGILLGLAALVALEFFWSLFGELGSHLVARMAVTAFGVVWIAVGLAYLVLIRNLHHGMALTILVFSCTWLNDTFAYFVGRAFGHRPMAPRISPKKSMEGAFGGIIGALLAAVLVKIYSPWLPLSDALLMGLAIGVVGQWGDLFESAVKRDFGVKDSGRILPGHGGILDRFDAILFVGFTGYWLALVLLGPIVQVPVK